MELSELKDGETVYAWMGPVMTLSLPPQATAILILANIPADYGVPQYYEISAVTPQAMIAIYPPPALTWTEVTTSDGATIKITGPGGADRLLRRHHGPPGGPGSRHPDAGLDQSERGALPCAGIPLCLPRLYFLAQKTAC